MSKYGKMGLPERRKVIDLINHNKIDGRWKDGAPKEAREAEKDILEYVKEQLRGKKSKKEKGDGK